MPTELAWKKLKDDHRRDEGLEEWVGKFIKINGHALTWNEAQRRSRDDIDTACRDGMLSVEELNKHSDAMAQYIVAALPKLSAVKNA